MSDRNNNNRLKADKQYIKSSDTQEPVGINNEQDKLFDLYKEQAKRSVNARNAKVGKKRKGKAVKKNKKRIRMREMLKQERSQAPAPSQALDESKTGVKDPNPSKTSTPPLKAGSAKTDNNVEKKEEEPKKTAASTELKDQPKKEDTAIKNFGSTTDNPEEKKQQEKLSQEEVVKNKTKVESKPAEKKEGEKEKTVEDKKEGDKAEENVNPEEKKKAKEEQTKNVSGLDALIQEAKKPEEKKEEPKKTEEQKPAKVEAEVKKDVKAENVDEKKKEEPKKTLGGKLAGNKGKTTGDEKAKTEEKKTTDDKNPEIKKVDTDGKDKIEKDDDQSYGKDENKQEGDTKKDPAKEAPEKAEIADTIKVGQKEKTAAEKLIEIKQNEAFQYGLNIGRSVGYGKDVTGGLENPQPLKDDAGNDTDTATFTNIHMNKTAEQANQAADAAEKLMEESPDNTYKREDFLKQYSSKVNAGYNQGYHEGRHAFAEHKKKRDDAALSDPDYKAGFDRGTLDGKAAGLGTKDADPDATTKALAEAKEMPAEKGEKFKKAYLRAYNQAYYAGRQEVVDQKAKGDPDPNYQKAKDLAFKIALTEASSTTAEAETKLKADQTITTSIKNVVDNGMKGLSEDGKPIPNDPEQKYKKGFGRGYNEGYYAGRHAVAKKKEEDIKKALNDPKSPYALGNKVGRVRAILEGLYENNVAKGMEENTLAKNLPKEAKDLCKESTATVFTTFKNGSFFHGEAGSDERQKNADTFKKAYMNGFNSQYQEARKNLRAHRESEKQKDPEYANGFKRGQSVGRAKTVMGDFDQMKQLEAKEANGDLSDNQKKLLVKLKDRVGNKGETFSKMDAQIKTYEQEIATGKVSEKFGQGYRAGVNSGYALEHKDMVKKAKEEKQQQMQALNSGDTSTPYAKGYQAGRATGLKVYKAFQQKLTPDERKTLDDQVKAALEQAKKLEDGGTEGVGFYSGFQYGLNMGMTNATLPVERASKGKLEEATKALDRSTDKYKEEHKSALQKGADDAQKFYYEAFKGPSPTGEVVANSKFGEEKTAYQKKLKEKKGKDGKKFGDDLVNEIIKSYEKGAGFTKDEAKQDGNAHYKGYQDGQAGKQEKLPDEFKESAEQYKEGHKEGKRGGGFSAFMKAMDQQLEVDARSNSIVQGVENAEEAQIIQSMLTEGYQYGGKVWVENMAKGLDSDKIKELIKDHLVTIRASIKEKRKEGFSPSYEEAAIAAYEEGLKMREHESRKMGDLQKKKYLKGYQKGVQDAKYDQNPRPEEFEKMPDFKKSTAQDIEAEGEGFKKGYEEAQAEIASSGIETAEKIFASKKANSKADKQGYDDAIKVWTKIDYLRRGMPIPEELKSVDVIKSLKTEVESILEIKTGNLTAGNEDDVVSDHQKQVDFANIAYQDQTHTTQMAADKFILDIHHEAYQTQEGEVQAELYNARITTLVQQGKTEEEAKKEAGKPSDIPLSTERKRAILDQVEQNPIVDKQKQLYIKSYTSGIKDALDTVAKAQNESDNYALGFQVGYRKASGKNTLPSDQDPSDAGELKKESDVSQEQSVTVEYNKGYKDGFDAGSNTKLGSNEAVKDATEDGRFFGGVQKQIHAAGMKKGKEDGEQDLVIIDQEFLEAKEKEVEKYAVGENADINRKAFNGGFDQTFYPLYNKQRGFVDGYEEEYKQKPRLTLQEHIDKDLRAYEDGLREGSRKAMYDKAAGIYDPKFSVNQLKMQQANEAADKKAADEEELNAQANQKSSPQLQEAFKNGAARAKGMLAGGVSTGLPSAQEQRDNIFTGALSGIVDQIKREGMELKHKELETDSTRPSPKLFIYNALVGMLKEASFDDLKNKYTSKPEVVGTENPIKNIVYDAKNPTGDAGLTINHFWNNIAGALRLYLKNGEDPIAIHKAQEKNETDDKAMAKREEQRQEVKSQVKQEGRFFDNKIKNAWKQYFFAFVDGFAYGYDKSLDDAESGEDGSDKINVEDYKKMAEAKASYDAYKSVAQRNAHSKEIQDFIERFITTEMAEDGIYADEDDGRESAKETRDLMMQANLMVDGGKDTENDKVHKGLTQPDKVLLNSFLKNLETVFSTNWHTDLKAYVDKLISAAGGKQLDATKLTELSNEAQGIQTNDDAQDTDAGADASKEAKAPDTSLLAKKQAFLSFFQSNIFPDKDTLKEAKLTYTKVQMRSSSSQTAKLYANLVGEVQGDPQKAAYFKLLSKMRDFKDVLVKDAKGTDNPDKAERNGDSADIFLLTLNRDPAQMKMTLSESAAFANVQDEDIKEMYLSTFANAYNKKWNEDRPKALNILLSANGAGGNNLSDAPVDESVDTNSDGDLDDLLNTIDDSNKELDDLTDDAKNNGGDNIFKDIYTMGIDFVSAMNAIPSLMAGKRQNMEDIETQILFELDWLNDLADVNSQDYEDMSANDQIILEEENKIEQWQDEQRELQDDIDFLEAEIQLQDLTVKEKNAKRKEINAKKKEIKDHKKAIQDSEDRKTQAEDDNEMLQRFVDGDAQTRLELEDKINRLEDDKYKQVDDVLAHLYSEFKFDFPIEEDYQVFDYLEDEQNDLLILEGDFSYSDDTTTASGEGLFMVDDMSSDVIIEAANLKLEWADPGIFIKAEGIGRTPERTEVFFEQGSIAIPRLEGGIIQANFGSGMATIDTSKGSGLVQSLANQLPELGHKVAQEWSLTGGRTKSAASADDDGDDDNNQ